MREQWVEKPVTMLSSEAKLSLLRGAGHRLEQLEYSTEVCSLRGTRSDNGEQITVTVTIGDAKRAGLIDKPIWKKYPRRMLFWRAVSELTGALCPDALMGLTADAQDFDDTPEPPAAAGGEVIDVELLQRVPTPAVALEAGATEDRQSAGQEPVDVSEASAGAEPEPPVERAPANPKLDSMNAVRADYGGDPGKARDCWAAMTRIKPWGAFDDPGAWAIRVERPLRRQSNVDASAEGVSAPAVEQCGYRDRCGRRLHPGRPLNEHDPPPGVRSSDHARLGPRAHLLERPGQLDRSEPSHHREARATPAGVATRSGRGVTAPIEDPLMYRDGAASRR